MEMISRSDHVFTGCGGIAVDILTLKPSTTQRQVTGSFSLLRNSQHFTQHERRQCVNDCQLESTETHMLNEWILFIHFFRSCSCSCCYCCSRRIWNRARRCHKNLDIDIQFLHQVQMATERDRALEMANTMKIERKGGWTQVMDIEWEMSNQHFCTLSQHIESISDQKCHSCVHTHNKTHMSPAIFQLASIATSFFI